MNPLFFGAFIPVTRRCGLQCLRCPIPDAARAESMPWQTTLSQGTFFRTYAENGFYHLIGGDPLSEPDVLKLLMALAKASKKVGLWTPLSQSLDVLAQVAPFVSRWYVYVPTSTPEGYLEETGAQSWAEFSEKLSYLVSEKRRVSLVSYVDRYTLEQLPVLYEFAYYKNLPLVLLYSRDGLSTKAHRHYVTYYRQKKQVTVIEISSGGKRCLGSPYVIPRKWLQYAWHMWATWVPSYL